MFSWLDAGDSVCLAGTALCKKLETKSEAFLGLMTSGTTSSPRVAWHAWRQLKLSVSFKAPRNWVWASPFRADSFAGVQVALQAWSNEGRCLRLGSDFVRNWACLEQIRPEALCCTPTFLDLLMISGANSETRPTWQPLQITLGGEHLSKRVGEAANGEFPRARVTVVYASAELGVIAKGHSWDGWLDFGSLDWRWSSWSLAARDKVLECNRPAVPSGG